METRRIKFMGLLFLILSSLTVNHIFAQNSNFSFSLSGGNFYNPGEEITINLYAYDYSDKSKRKVEFDITVFKINNPEEFYSKQSERGRIDIFGVDSTNLLFLTSEIRNFTQSISSKNEYNYTYLNDDIKISGLDAGAYITRVKNGNKVAYLGFVVSGNSVIAKAGVNTMLGFAINKQSGLPVENANLNFYVGMIKVGSGITKDGVAFTDFNLKNYNLEKSNTFPLIIGSFQNEIIVSDPYLYFGYGQNNKMVYIYTNQPVYRTDSEVNFKAILRASNNYDYTPIKFETVTVKIKDSKGAEVYKELLTTNDMGSLNGTFRIDKDAPLGNYLISVEFGENETYSESFKVEQYKKPEYKVTVKANQSQYLNRDNIKAEISADYYFGSPVANAEVEYNIYKMRYYRPWWKYSEYAFWYEDYYSEMEENYSGSEMIYSGTGKLNSEGKLEIDYTIDENFKTVHNGYRWWYYDENSDFKYIIQARVTDKSRREISGVTSVLVTRGQFSITANTSKYMYKPGEEAVLNITTMDFTDKPVSTEYFVNVYKYTYYWEKDNGKESKDLVTSFSGKTNSEGKGTSRFTVPGNAEGYYTIEIRANDERGNKIEASTGFYVYKDGFTYQNDNNEIQIITDKDSYRQGDTVKAVVFYPNSDPYTLITAESDNILYYKSGRVTGTTSEYLIYVDEKFNSNFKIEANYIKDGNVYTGSKNLLLIQDRKLLTVEIDPSKLIYKPKETGIVKVRVLDYNGNPVRNAEVGVGIIDESIYAIQEETTQDIRKFFYGPKYVNVSTTFNTNNYNYAYSRLLSIYERFNVKSLKESDLATVKGRLMNKNGVAISNAIIIIDEEYEAAETDENGNFEFKLPAGDYEISIFSKNKKNVGVKELKLTRGEVKDIILYDDREMNEIVEEITSKQTELSTEKINLRGGRTNEAVVIVEGETYDKKSKDAPKNEGTNVAPDIRSDFRDAILWSPYLKTDDNGYAEVEVKFPDNLTQWRITSRVITEDTKVGQNVNTVITRKDLLVRMETPRFFNQGDNVTISTVIHNYLDSEKRTTVNFKSENADLQNAKQQIISIPANSEVRLDWNLKITNPTGEAKLYAEALTNQESDAVEMKVPLQPSGLKLITNSIADFDDFSKTEIKNINIPFNSNLKTANMNLTVSPSLASTILTSLDELAGYPYGCVEQTMSRFLPTVVVASAFKELNAPISEATERNLPKMVETGLNRLYGFQHSDGGWGWWRNDASDPFMTAYVVYGLNIADKSGYKLKSNVKTKGINALKNQAKKDLDFTTKAYVLYSLSLSAPDQKTLIEEEADKLTKENLSDYAKSLLVLIYNEIGNNQKAEEMISLLVKDVKYSGEGAAYWETENFRYNWQNDKVQTTALALKAIVKLNYGGDLKNKIVRWLMSQRQGLAWRNTQETAFIVYSMVDYLKNSDELNPDYSIRVFVNENEVMNQNITRDDVFKKDKLIKIDNAILKQGDNIVRIEKTGNGKVYFSSATTFYTAESQVPAYENGFRVEREYSILEKYESYNENKITYRKNYFNGNVYSGDVMLVKVRVYTKDKDLTYFMLEDPIPAGCEVVDDDWAYNIEGEKDFSGYDYYYWRWWYADKEVRDDKVTFFATRLFGDVFEFSYIIRAQIPGNYNVNPSVGSLMYYTDVNGNSPSMLMNILDK